MRVSSIDVKRSVLERVMVTSGDREGRRLFDNPPGRDDGAPRNWVGVMLTSERRDQPISCFFSTRAAAVGAPAT